MTKVITRDNLFRPARSKAETKAEITDHTARAIIDAETERRETKSARLRQIRLEKEAEEAATATPPPKLRRTKAPGPKRGRSSR